MRPLHLQRLPGQSIEDYVDVLVAEIDRAAYEDVEAVIDDLEVSNFTATRTLNAGTATLADVANFICTLVDDVKNRGRKRT